MPKMERIYTEMIRFRLTPEQKEWLEQKAAEQSGKLAKEVKPPHVVRALINRQMDLEREQGKVWDG